MPAPAPPLIPNTHSLHTRVNGIHLHCLQSGNPSNPAVILLHGFPDFSYSWRYQIPALTAAGFHVLASDLRGYNLSDKPPRVSDYHLEHLAADVSALISTHTPGRAALVGHDWGGVIAFHAAMRFPNLLSKLVVLNAPHPAAYRRQLPRGQLLRSYYALLFQLPWLPEFILQSNDAYLFRRVLRQGPARASTSPDIDVRHYLTAFAHPRALRSAINYYRAALRPHSTLFHRSSVIPTSSGATATPTSNPNSPTTSTPGSPTSAPTTSPPPPTGSTTTTPTASIRSFSISLFRDSPEVHD